MSLSVSKRNDHQVPNQLLLLLQIWLILSTILSPLSHVCHLCYPVLSPEWDHIFTLASEENLEELEWLIHLLTTTDPYLVEDVHPIAQIYPFTQVEYTKLVKFLVLLCAEVGEIASDDWTDETHGLTDEDFVYVDDQDGGVALGLPTDLYNILLP